MADEKEEIERYFDSRTSGSPGSIMYRERETQSSDLSRQMPAFTAEQEVVIANQ